MFGLWSFLRQFMYTKFIIVTDDDIDIRDWKEVVWAITTRCDPVRDTTLVEQHADRLPRLCVARGWARRQDGPGCHDEMACGNEPPVGQTRSHTTPRRRRRMAQVYDRLMADRSSEPAA